MKLFGLFVGLFQLLVFLHDHSASASKVVYNKSCKDISFTSSKPNLAIKDSKISVLVKAKNAALQGGLHGSFAAFLQVVSLMWIRTIINYQYRYGTSFSTAVKELYSQGGVRRFYKGLSYAVVQGPLLKFGVVAAHEGSRAFVDHWSQKSADDSPTYAPLYSTLGVAGLSVLWRILLMPLETCKTVLQVQGLSGFRVLVDQVATGKLWLLYEGTLATICISFVAYYPWFFVHDWLDGVIARARGSRAVIVRSALIGFAATVVSDCCSNFLRVLKTIKQTAGVAGTPSAYWSGSLSSSFPEMCRRGLLTRILANGVQTVLFTVVWKLLQIHAKRKESARRIGGGEIDESV